MCAGGVSEAPNEIVFCERCDVAVHQACYGIDAVPEGEWLCWPCHAHEAKLRADGVPQDRIRPPRWASAAGGRCLGGGAASTECALCPNKWGAYKGVRGDGRWVHLVCANFQPEVSVDPGGRRQLGLAGGGTQQGASSC